MTGSSDGFDGDIELGVIGIAVGIETMVTYDVTKGEHVKDKEEGTKH